MQYYIREDERAKVEGPFTVSALKEAILSGEMAPTFLASSDLGESCERLQAWRRCDWFPLTGIPELWEIKSCRPLPPFVTKPDPYSKNAVICTWVATFGSLYSAMSDGGWYTWFLFSSMLIASIMMHHQFLQKRMSPKVQ